MRNLPTRPALDDEATAADPAACAACDACPGPELPERRRFLRDAAVAATAALLSLGLSRAAAAAIPVRDATALGARGSRASYALPPADGVSIDRDNEVILVRWQNAVYAFALACPHQNTALRWNGSEGRFQCPKHKSQYRPDGTFISGRATRGMDRFSIKRQANGVVVDLDALHEEDEDASGWAAAVVKL